MIGRIRENEKLRKNIRFLKTMDNYNRPVKIKKVRYKHVTKAEMKKIRQEIRVQNRKEGIHLPWALLLSVLIFVGLFLIIAALT